MPGPADDVLILGQPLGVGIYSAALERAPVARRLQACWPADSLNTPGIALGRLDAVHALTDVTGFGLLGHLSRSARAAALPRRSILRAFR
jgi:selenide,water dikinase